MQKLIDVWIDFLSFWLRFGDQVRTQEPLKTTPERPHDTTKASPRQPKSHKSSQDQNLVAYWSLNPMGYHPSGLDVRGLGFQFDDALFQSFLWLLKSWWSSMETI